MAAIDLAFPHNNKFKLAAINLDEIYDDVLDFLKYAQFQVFIKFFIYYMIVRPKFSGSRAQHRAWKAVMVQIGRRQTNQLEKSLAKRPKDEISHFVAEAVKCMPEER